VGFVLKVSKNRKAGEEMKLSKTQLILEVICMIFLGIGFYVEGNPLVNLACFAIAAIIGWIYIRIEEQKERDIFKK
jgi:NhaP-type Na+/H+ or K+/H+ antiporter